VEKERAEERDRWFAQARPVPKPTHTWREKWLAREERSDDSSTESSEAGEVETGAAGKDHNLPTEALEINMVFAIPAEFHVPESSVAELVVGAERAIFEKPEKADEHMKPLFIRGHMDGVPMGHMLVDGGANVNIMPLSVFKRLGHGEGDLKQTNLSLSGFSVEPTEAKR
jgi:hypothetical protein